MKTTYNVEIGFLVLVIAVSLAGFSSLALGAHPELTAYHVLHIGTSLGWLLLLFSQLVSISRNRFARHRRIGMAIFVAGPLVIGSVSLLTVHSAAKDAALGRADGMIVQNVTFALEVSLLVLLAFVLRHRRKAHGALLMSTALMFLVIALFFTLISYVPGFRADGSVAPRFAAAGQTAGMVGSVIGLLFFLRQWRTGWPWLLTASFFMLDGFAQGMLAGTERAKSLTMLVASIGRAPAFASGLVISLLILGAAWRRRPGARAKRVLSTAPSGA